MSDIANPAEDTWTAIKNRIAGPFGTFIVIWSISHAKILAMIFFRTSIDDNTPEAFSKIEAISILLSTEDYWTLILLPILFTVAVLILTQLTSLAWHIIADWFRYIRERITHRNDLKVYLYKRFGQNPDDFIANIRSEIVNARDEVRKAPNIYNTISATNKLDRYELTLKNIRQKCTDEGHRLDEIVKLLNMANDQPLIQIARDFWMKNMKSKKNK